MKKATIFLSRRNLEVLLSKLDRQAAGQETACTIIKYKNLEDPPEFAQQLDEITITAIQNGEYSPFERKRPARPAKGFPSFEDLDLYEKKLKE
jgi:hypothetical protein